MIDNLSIRNFKCLSEVSLDLRPISVLTGLNGMGKSSIIQSLLLLHQSFNNSHNSMISDLLLNGPLVNIGTAKDALWEGAQEDQLAFKLSSEGQEYSWNFAYAEGEDELKIIGDQFSVPNGLGIFGDSFHYLSAERLGPRSAFPTSHTSVRQHRQIGKNGEYAPFFLDTFGTEPLQNSKLLHPSATSVQLKHQLEAWLSEISPGTRIYTETHRNLDLVSLSFAFESTLGETQHFRSTNVGFGISYIMPIILTILSATSGSLVLLENPEAHLHPRGQSKMGELLGIASVSGVQILVETHSDHLLNGIRLAVKDGHVPHENCGIFFLERSQDQGTVSTLVHSPKIDSDGRIDSWPEGFFDETEKSLRRLLSSDS